MKQITIQKFLEDMKSQGVSKYAIWKKTGIQQISLTLHERKKTRGVRLETAHKLYKHYGVVIMPFDEDELIKYGEGK